LILYSLSVWKVEFNFCLKVRAITNSPKLNKYWLHWQINLEWKWRDLLVNSIYFSVEKAKKNNLICCKAKGFQIRDQWSKQQKINNQLLPYMKEKNVFNFPSLSWEKHLKEVFLNSKWNKCYSSNNSCIVLDAHNKTIEQSYGTKKTVKVMRRAQSWGQCFWKEIWILFNSREGNLKYSNKMMMMIIRLRKDWIVVDFFWTELEVNVQILNKVHDFY